MSSTGPKQPRSPEGPAAGGWRAVLLPLLRRGKTAGLPGGLAEAPGPPLWREKGRLLEWQWLENMFQNGIFVNGTKDWNLRNPGSWLLSHTQIRGGTLPLCTQVQRKTTAWWNCAIYLRPTVYLDGFSSRVPAKCVCFPCAFPWNPPKTGARKKQDIYTYFCDMAYGSKARTPREHPNPQFKNKEPKWVVN